MATRRDIKKAVRSEVVTASDPQVPPERILYTSQEVRDVEYPKIVLYQLDVPTHKYDGTQAPPYKFQYDVDGNKTAAVYAAHYIAYVDITIQGVSMDTDTLFNAITDQWEPYQMGWKPESDLHDDCTHVMLEDVGGEPNRDTEPTEYASVISLQIEYTRDVVRDGTPIENIYHNYDVDQDGTTDVTYTTSSQ